MVGSGPYDTEISNRLFVRLDGLAMKTWCEAGSFSNVVGVGMVYPNALALAFLKRPAEKVATVASS